MVEVTCCFGCGKQGMKLMGNDALGNYRYDCTCCNRKTVIIRSKEKNLDKIGED